MKTKKPTKVVKGKFPATGPVLLDRGTDVPFTMENLLRLIDKRMAHGRKVSEAKRKDKK